MPSAVVWVGVSCMCLQLWCVVSCQLQVWWQQPCAYCCWSELADLQGSNYDREEGKSNEPTGDEATGLEVGKSWYASWNDAKWILPQPLLDSDFESVLKWMWTIVFHFIVKHVLELHSREPHAKYEVFPLYYCHCCGSSYHLLSILAQYMWHNQEVTTFRWQMVLQHYHSPWSKSLEYQAEWWQAFGVALQ